MHVYLFLVKAQDLHACLEEAKQLVEAGFDYVTDMIDCKLFRKRK